MCSKETHEKQTIFYGVQIEKYAQVQNSKVMPAILCFLVICCDTKKCKTFD